MSAAEPDGLREQLRELRRRVDENDTRHRNRYHELKTDIAALPLISERLTLLGKEMEAHDLAVLADRLDRLSKSVGLLTASALTLILTVLSGIIVFLVAHGAGP